MIRTLLSALGAMSRTLRRVPSMICSAPTLLRGLVTDPRLALIAVPLAGVALLMGMNGEASNAAVTTTTTTTIVEAAPTTTAAPDTEVLGAEAYAPAEEVDGSIAGGGAGRSSGTRSGSSNPRTVGAGSSSGAANGAGGALNGALNGGLNGAIGGSVPGDAVVGEATTTVPGDTATTTTAGGGAPTTVPGGVTPEPVIAEAPSPILMLVLAVGVAAIAGNGLAARRRLAAARLSDRESAS